MDKAAEVSCQDSNTCLLPGLLRFNATSISSEIRLALAKDNPVVLALGDQARIVSVKLFLDSGMFLDAAAHLRTFRLPASTPSYL